MNNFEILQRSRTSLWNPCTQMKQHETLPLIPLARGEGAWLYDFDGRRYLDAISSWWVNLFGHGHPVINAAIQDQLVTLEHAMLAGFTHLPAVELAERLSALAPAGLGHCFFASDGASAVEIALKMSFHYWQNNGRPEKKRFIHLAQSYHGETIGALSVTDVAIFKDVYAPLVASGIAVPSPDSRLAATGETPREFALRCASELEATLEANHHEVGALIVEPLVQCAAGMAMYDPAYLVRARQLCDRYDVHLIADEIAVGFGRTGTFFAWEQVQACGLSNSTEPESAAPTRTGPSATVSGSSASGETGTFFAWEQVQACDLSNRTEPESADPARTGPSPAVSVDASSSKIGPPDFLCLSKGISGGYLPLSAVLTTDDVYQAFYADDVRRAFLHSHSYTGNPLACRAALATLDLFERENVLEKNRAKAAYLDSATELLKSHLRVEHSRRTGMIWAFDVREAPADFAPRFFSDALAHELLLRPIGSTVYFMPPYIIDSAEIDFLLRGVKEILDAL